MAYRNHPTRYLIVKDPGRLGPGPPHSAARREPRVVTPGRPPCQHLFSTSRIAVRVAVALPVSRSGGAFLRVPVRPVNTFFQLGALRFRVAPRAPVSRSGGAIYPTAFGPSTPFFKLPGNHSSPDRASGFPSCGGALLRVPADTVNTFFQLPRAALSRRPPCPGFPKRRGYIPDRIRPVNTFFQASGESSSPGPRFRLPVVRRCASTPPRRHRQHVFSIFPRGYAFSQSPVAVFRSGEWLSTWGGPARQVKYCPRFWCSPKHHLFQMFVNHTFPGPTHSA